MIVEFFGLPGSGKTVNTEALLLHYGERAHQLLPKRSVLRKGGFRRIFTLEFLSFFFKAVSLWLKKKHKVRYDIRVLYYFALLYLSYMKHRDSHGAYEILDHGLVQCVSSLAWDEPKLYESCNALFRHFCRYFAGSIQFVFTDFSEDDILVDRILNRKSEVRLKHFSPQEAKRVLQMQRRLFAQAAASLQKDFSILQIDSSADVSDNTARICQQLDRQG